MIIGAILLVDIVSDGEDSVHRVMSDTAGEATCRMLSESAQRFNFPHQVVRAVMDMSKEINLFPVQVGGGGQ